LIREASAGAPGLLRCAKLRGGDIVGNFIPV
jgi:hypothetical protein